MEALDSFYGVRPTETVPVLFEWRSRARTVSVTGDFLGWGPGLELKEEADGRFALTLLLRPGQTLHYKFIVDGEWTLSSDLPVERDATGNANHVLRVPGEDVSRSASSTSGTSSATHAAVEAAATPDGPAAPVAFGGYIGAGVHREYTEEYNLEVEARPAKSGMQRSVSFADVGSINLALLQPWGKGSAPDKGVGLAGRAKGTAASRGLSLQQKPPPVVAPVVVPPAEPMYEFAASLDLGGAGVPASPAMRAHALAVPGSDSGNASPMVTTAAPGLAGAAGGFGTSGRTQSAGTFGTAGSGSSAAGGASAMGTRVPSLRTMASLAGSTAPASATTTTMTTVQDSLRREGKLVLSMVGLPARGKTFIARRLKRHLTWMGYKTEIFNVGNYRRAHLGATKEAGFFDPSNTQAEVARRDVARIACEEMCAALCADAYDIAIFDATNTTLERRRWLKGVLAAKEAETGVKFQLVFIESVCNDERIIESNVRETKLKSPDYKGFEEEVAVADFLQRIQFYVSVYQPLADAEEVPYIKLIDVGRQIIANRVQGYLNSRVLFFLSNLHITPRPIYLSRHGESEYNVQGRIGGDTALSPRGETYAQRLGALFRKLHPPDTNLIVWTSSLKRTQLTAAHIGRPIVAWKALDEIDAGVCDGMTYEEIAATMPEEYAARGRQKFSYRYPRGESYQDMVSRLEPVLIELMRQKDPILIVSHQATLRVVLAYLRDLEPRLCPDLLVPLHCLMQMVPKAYGSEELHYANAQLPGSPPPESWGLGG